MRKAEVLGLETRNVSQGYLQPVQRASNGSFTNIRGEDPLGLHFPSNNPKSISSYKTTRQLQSLGQKAIFSSNPYVDAAFESIAVPRGIPPEPSETALVAQPRRIPTGRLPKRGSKASAIARAKRLVGQGANITTEVPFPDSLRVCNPEKDRSAIPALLRAYIFSKNRLNVVKLEEYCELLSKQKPLVQLQAATVLMQHGYFFAAIKVVYSEYEALSALLEEMKIQIAGGADPVTGQPISTTNIDWERAAISWNWKDPDRELFLKQFRELRIISYYLDVRRQLRVLKEQGAVALARVEKEMLLKVIKDFQAQLDEDYKLYQQQLAKEAIERGRAKARLDAQSRSAAEAAIRRSDQASSLEAKQRSILEARERQQLEFRDRLAEKERHREEVRLRAEERRKARLAKRNKKAGQPRSMEMALMQGEAADMFLDLDNPSLMLSPSANAVAPSQSTSQVSLSGVGRDGGGEGAAGGVSAQSSVASVGSASAAGGGGGTGGASIPPPSLALKDTIAPMGLSSPASKSGGGGASKTSTPQALPLEVTPRVVSSGLASLPSIKEEGRVMFTPTSPAAVAAAAAAAAA
eukprot:CAMPEP_0175068822 /NCGR_PEP_ID=MMETSP0052_2-20121109/17874_1 /TAXON_ID=51329 ORGANISM="Polytomella parva, Strain SAG 63-3" /NCGR_SAMPLE_ID=MMETSP0052_2 /ASSEMBLY_ACC=CAM_ASM_000194 /LENGTH=579 /DNA_ID=CAMNT_0016335871 /DNA_START=194 /DNA_END=1929 /DNA_ORIENTATION=-